MFSAAAPDLPHARTRFAQAVLTHRFQLVVALCALSLPLILLFTWLSSNHWLHAQLNVAQQQTQKRVDIEAQLMDLALSATFTQLQGIPEMLSQERQSQDALRAPSAANVAQLNAQLQNMARYLNVGDLWVLNRDGVCIAASNAGRAESFVGVDYSDRDYYRLAKTGQPGRQFAIGRRTNQPSFYFSAPILLDGRFAGAAVVRIQAAQLVRWIKASHTFITDHNDLVVLATDPKLLYKAMPSGRVLRMSQPQLQRQYKRQAVEPLPLEPSRIKGLSGALQWGADPTPLLMSQRRQPSGYTVYSIGRLGEYQALLTQRWILFAGLSLGLTAIIWAAVATLIYSQHARLQSRLLDHSNRTLAHLNAELWQQANHDFLTGLYNRRHFKERLDAECARLHREPGLLTLAMIDLDHFKHINDSCGHDVGDEVLAEVARLLLDHTREPDLVGRLGGEEFAVLMPGTSIEAGTAVAERLRELLAEHPRLSSAGPVPITLSAGLSHYQAGDHANQLLRRADAALYCAKRNGRNRVVVYDPAGMQTDAPMADIPSTPPATPT